MQNKDSEYESYDQIQQIADTFHYNVNTFTNIYIFSGILFSLSALFPIIEESGKIKLFWIADMTPELFIITLLIIGVGFGIGVLAKRLKPYIRSKLFFIPIAVLLTIANLFLGMSDGPNTGYALVYLIGIYAPFLYFSYTILVSVYDMKKYRAATCITGVISISLIFVPTFVGHNLYEYAFNNPGAVFWLFTFTIFFITVIFNLCSYFIKFLRDNAKINVYLLTLSYISIAVSAIMSVLPTSLSNLSDYLKLFFAAYGIFFIFTVSLVEIYLAKKNDNVVQFAQPVVKNIEKQNFEK